MREVSGGPLGIVGGEEHAALEYELLGVPGGAEACQPAFQDVEREELLRTTAFCPGAVLQIEVGTAGFGRSRRPAHPALAMSRACRTGP